MSADWLQLSSREWLKGELLGMYESDLEFDSDEFDVRTFDWDDLREVRTARTMRVSVVGGEVLVGRLVVVGDRVIVLGEQRREVTRSQVITITRAAAGRPLRNLGAEIAFGATVRQGNVDQVDANVNARVRHRTVENRLALDYLANFAETDGAVTADDQRLSGQWSHFLTERTFVVPIAAEYYRDPFLNTGSRLTVGAGAGYRLIHTRRTDWEISGAVGYQVVRFDDVAAGDDDAKDTGAFGGSTTFEQDWTKAVDFTFDYTFHIVNEASGRYDHHVLVSVETELSRVLELDVSLIWDRTERPQPGPDGSVPEQDDLRMVVALEIEL